jgi:hypothetical protein
MMSTASEPNANAVGAMTHDVRVGEHRNERSGLVPSGVQHSAGGTNHASQSSDVLPCQRRSGDRMMSTASEPNVSAVGTMVCDVRVAEHRNEMIGVVPSGVRHSAGGANHDSQYSDVPYGRNRNGDRSTASEPNASAVGQHRNGAMPVPTASEPNASAVGAMACDVRHGEHRNGWSGLAPSGVRYSA